MAKFIHEKILLLALAFFICSQSALKIAIGDELKHGGGEGAGSETEDLGDFLDEADGPDAAEVEVEDGEQKITVREVTLTTVNAGFEIESSTGAEVKIPLGMATELGLATGDTLGYVVAIPASTDHSSVGVSDCSTVEVELYKYPGGVKANKVALTVKDLSKKIQVKLPGCTGKGLTCKYYDEAKDEYTTSGVTTISSGSKTVCETDHLTEFGAFGGSGGASGDPKATNLAGQKFEILQLGTFSLLSITNAPEGKKRLTMDATIDRAGELCGATYIRNISMAGSWIEEVQNLNHVRIRAAPGVPKYNSLQVAFHDDWEDAKAALQVSEIVEKASAKEIKLHVHGVKIQVKIDAHRIRKNGVPTDKFANFLNVDVKGLAQAQENGTRMGGLLAYDDHSFAMQVPDGCKQKSFHFKQSMRPLDTDVSTQLLSSIRGA